MEFVIEKEIEASKLDDILNQEDLLKYIMPFSFEAYNELLSETEEIEKPEIINPMEMIEELTQNKEMEEEPKQTVYYYVPQTSNNKHQDFYIFTPNWVTILRAPQSELGEGVLGLAYPYLGLIKILESLTGTDFLEVKKHELNHVYFPWMSEEMIRFMTKNELPFYTRYH